jgi:phosphate-selective porin OprO/OprP
MDIKDAVYHIGASYGDSRDNGSNSAIALRTEARGTNVLQTNTLNLGYDIKRTGLEGAVAYGPVKFQAEWLKAKFEADGDKTLVVGGTAGDKDITSWNVQLNWLVTGEPYADTYKNGMFGGRIKPKADFNPRAGLKGWGAWDIGVRYSKFDATDFEAKDTVDVYSGTIQAENGEFNESDAWTYGVKWIPNPNTRFILDYIDTNMDCVSGVVCTKDDEKAINFRAQFDF